MCVLLQVHEVTALRERHVGVLHGHTHTEAMALEPDAWAALRHGGRGVRIAGGGESADDLQQRVVAAVQAIADKHPGKHGLAAWRLAKAKMHPLGLLAYCADPLTSGALHAGERVLVVTHGGVLHALHHHARGYMFRGKALNGALNELHVDSSRWALVRWNDAAHLQRAGAASAGFGGGVGEA